eukprot:304303-Pleurochrysis_carterae.AAC.2
MAAVTSSRVRPRPVTRLGCPAPYPRRDGVYPASPDVTVQFNHLWALYVPSLLCAGRRPAISATDLSCQRYVSGLLCAGLHPTIPGVDLPAGDCGLFASHI